MGDCQGGVLINMSETINCPSCGSEGAILIETPERNGYACRKCKVAASIVKSKKPVATTT